MAQFGEKLVGLRQKHKLTQLELASAIFVSVSTISNYEKGIHFPDLDKLMAIADFFDVTTDYLLGRTKVNLSPDAFAQEIIDGKTAGDFISDLRSLTSERKHCLSLVISDMKLSMMVNEYGRRNKEVDK